MLRKLEAMSGFTIQAVDGEIGRVDDFLFDDQNWTIRYLVVDTGGWLSGRQVLISPVALESPQWEIETLPVNLTQEQVESSPEISRDQPVSRQQEEILHAHYGWPLYWAGGGPVQMGYAGMAGPPPASTIAAQAAVQRAKVAAEQSQETQEESGDPNLRSVKEVTGYQIAATDGEIGHVTDFFASEQDWIIRYMLVKTRNWLPGRTVLIAPNWIERISWTESQVQVDLTREQIKDSPEYEPGHPVGREYETELYRHYGFPGYWV
jgi:uncharacterized protein YrrD